MRRPVHHEALTMAYDERIQDDADRSPNHGGTIGKIITGLDESSESQAVFGAQSEGERMKCKCVNGGLI